MLNAMAKADAAKEAPGHAAIEIQAEAFQRKVEAAAEARAAGRLH
jgi:hypothetical protein